MAKGRIAIPLAALGRPGTLPLAARSVRRLAGEWGVDDDLARRRGRADIEVLATRFWQLAGGAGGGGGGDAGSSAWHHLVLAAGAARRRSTLSGLAGLLGPPPAAPQSGPATLRIPGRRDAEVRVDEPESWPYLTSVCGLAPARASVLLAALWPATHAVLDRSIAAALLGFAATSPEGQLPDLFDKKGDVPARDWSLYLWYWRTLRLTRELLAEEGADVAPAEVERALSRLDELVLAGLGRREPGGARWRWSRYGSLARDAAGSGPADPLR